jgi:LysM repeat protein
VRQGDTLGAIARRTGVSIAKLKKLNGMKNSSVIRAGRRIRIH